MAMILPNSVFVHIPKTGGTTIKQALGRAGVRMRLSGTDDMERYSQRQHAHYAHVRQESGDRRVIASIRDTVSWYTSVWCHQKRTGTGNGITGTEMWVDHFERWFWNVIEKKPGEYNRLLCAMLNGSENPLLIRTDKLLAGLVTALTLAGEDFEIRPLVNTPPANVAAAEKSLCVWTDDMKQAIVETEGMFKYPDGFLSRYEENLLG